MTDNRLSVRGKKQAVWNYVLHAETMAGTQFVVAEPGGQLYVVLGTTNEVIHLPTPGHGGGAWFSYLQTTYGLTEREDYAKFVYDVLRAYTYRNGQHAELRRFAVYARGTRTAYMSAYDGRMFKIDGENISLVPTGEDCVFFADDDGGMHVDPDIGPHGQLIQRLTDINFAPCGLSGITPEQQKMALVIWAFALAFPDLMPTKPLLMIEGVKGSGKTSAVKLLQLILMGASRPMIIRKSKEDDFGVILLRSPIAMFDNVDAYIDWVPDAIAAYTTGAVWNSRKLYTDDEQLVIKPHAFIAVATRNPASFRRDDVADRCIILRLERRRTFTAEAALTQQVIDNRPALLGEYLWYVGQIVRELRAVQGFAMDQTDRMADFAALGHVIARVMGWEADAVNAMLEAMQGERDTFISEDDPLVELLQRWLAYRPRGGRSNIGRTISALDLHSELETLAQGGMIEWRDSVRVLQQKLRTTNIERAFHIQISNVGGTRMFQLWRHSDPRLEIVDEEATIKVPP